MARIKVKLQDSTPARFVWIDTGATVGATLGTNVFTPDGLVGTPATVRRWLGVEAAQDPRSPPSGAGTNHHHLLIGLEADDHPQYTQWVQDEDITGQWDFFNLVRIEQQSGNVDPQAPTITQYIDLQVLNPDVTYVGGIELSTLTDPLVDPQLNGVGSQLAFWEVKDAYGFRIRNDGQVDNDGDLNFYRHANSLAGVLFLKFTRDSNVIQFHPGSATEPIIATFNDLDTGIYWPATNQVAFSTGGAVALLASTTQVVSSLPFRIPTGSDNAPGLSFDGDTNTGIFRGVTANVIAFTTDGVERFRIGNVDTTGGTTTAGIRSTLSFRGPAGSATVPAFTFTGDDNTGMLSVAADQLGFVAGGTLRLTLTTTELVSTVGYRAPDGSASACGFGFTNDIDIGLFRVGTNTLGIATAGTERLRIDANGAWGLGGANFGTAGQVLQSNGSGSPPTWEDQSGGGGGADRFASYLTVEDETYYLPNSRYMIAGTGITFDDTVAGQRTISAGTADPRLRYELFYDFDLLTGTAAIDGWDNNVTGTAAAIAGVAISGRPGVIQLSSGTGNGAQAGVMRSVDAVTAPTTGIVIGGGEITFKCKMRWVGSTGPTNTTATNCFLRVGLVNEISGAPTDGIYITTDGENSAGAFANEWLFGTRTTAGGLTYDQDTAIAIADGTWVEAKIIVSADGATATAYIDGVLFATTTATMPAGVALNACAQIQRAGAIGTNFVIQVDYIEVVQVFTTAR